MVPPSVIQLGPRLVKHLAPHFMTHYLRVPKFQRGQQANKWPLSTFVQLASQMPNKLVTVVEQLDGHSIGCSISGKRPTLGGLGSQ